MKANLHEVYGPIIPVLDLTSNIRCISMQQGDSEVSLFFRSESSLREFAQKLNDLLEAKEQEAVLFQSVN